MEKQNQKQESKPIVIIGCGLSGLCAAIEASKNPNQEIIILEKEKKIGGNSAKASSGINGTNTNAQIQHINLNKTNHYIKKNSKNINYDDSIQQFIDDTLKSGKGLSNSKLVETQVKNSKSAINFLNYYCKISLDVLCQCGGHSKPRTHRVFSKPGEKPRNIGSWIIGGLKQYVSQKKNISIYLNSKALKLIKNNNNEIEAIQFKETFYNDEKIEIDSKINTIKVKAVIICTGGYGQDRKRLLKKYSPHLLDFPSTNAIGSKGDGINLGEQIGAKLVHLDQVQVHPTGFVDSKNPSKKNVFLAPEALRASGGIMFNQSGERFCNELETRDKVSKSIIDNCSKGKFEKVNGPKHAILLLNKKAAELFNMNILNFYKKFGLIYESESIQDFSNVNNLSEDKIKEEILLYQKVIDEGKADQFGKTRHPVNWTINDDKYYYCYVTPSIHYTMGGLGFNEKAEVLNTKNLPISRLFAAGETTGGLHGGNRLAGNSLLECVVFGRIAGKNALKLK